MPVGHFARVWRGRGEAVQLRSLGLGCLGLFGPLAEAGLLDRNCRLLRVVRYLRVGGCGFLGQRARVLDLGLRSAGKGFARRLTVANLFLLACLHCRGLNSSGLRLCVWLRRSCVGRYRYNARLALVAETMLSLAEAGALRLLLFLGSGRGVGAVNRLGFFGAGAGIDVAVANIDVGLLAHLCQIRAHSRLHLAFEIGIFDLGPHIFEFRRAARIVRNDFEDHVALLGANGFGEIARLQGKGLVFEDLV